MAVERVLSNLNLIKFKTEGGLQNHIDELQDGDLVFTPDSSLKGNLFDFKWTDHKLNDISWLNADTFSWQSGDVYVAAFEHLANDYISLSGKGVLYAWTNTAGDETYYTKTSTPSVGDQLFDETGTPAIVSNSYVNGEISVVFVYADGSITYARTDPNAMLGRDTSKDVTLSAPQSETETISGITIRYYKADDGHKICMQDQESKVQALYEATGVAWYYILDTANKQFKLPRTKFGFTGLRDSVGNYVAEGLPNIMGTVGYLKALKTGNYYQAINYSSGAFKSSTSDTSGLSTKPAAAETGTQEATSAGGILNFSASDYSAVYGASNTVQPKATQMYLYFYVGNFERDAIEQTAGINAEMFSNKADSDLKNTPFASLDNDNGTLKWNGINMSAMGMPSSKYEEWTLGASGASYAVQKDGYITISKRSTAVNQYINIIDSATRLSVSANAVTTGQNSRLFCPVRNGSSFTINYDLGGETLYFRFVYVEGAK